MYTFIVYKYIKEPLGNSIIKSYLLSCSSKCTQCGSSYPHPSKIAASNNIPDRNRNHLNSDDFSTNSPDNNDNSSSNSNNFSPTNDMNTISIPLPDDNSEKSSPPDTEATRIKEYHHSVHDNYLLGEHMSVQCYSCKNSRFSSSSPLVTSPISIRY